jgi:hypothetical protein
MAKLLAEIRFLSVIFTILLCSSACGDDLSRGNAGRQISQKLQLPAVQTTRIPRIALKRATSAPGGGFMPAITICQDHGTQWADVRYRMEALKQKGLVELGQETRKSGKCTYEYTTIALTPEGERYLVREADDGYVVRTHTLTFGEVTGIRTIDELKAAEAQYTLKIDDVTPFSGSLPREPVPQSATFQLFDDGWRIQ